jgi:hypothetical protein
MKGKTVENYAERVEREDEEDRLKKIGAYVTDYPHYERLWVMGNARYIGGTSLVALDKRATL